MQGPPTRANLTRRLMLRSFLVLTSRISRRWRKFRYCVAVLQRRLSESDTRLFPKCLLLLDDEVILGGE